MCTTNSFVESLTINTQKIEVKLGGVLNRMKPEYGDKDLNASIFTDFVTFQAKMKKGAFFFIIVSYTLLSNLNLPHRKPLNLEPPNSHKAN